MTRGGQGERVPAGTVTLLLADVEGSTRLWEAQPAEMTEAISRLDDAVADVVAAHDGVRPVEQGEGDSFVVAFTRASDAVAAALDLQRAELGPVRLRIGIHAGEVQLRDEGNYVGAAVNRCARLRDIAHGGQTVLSQAAHDLVVDHLPIGAYLVDLGMHSLRDLARAEMVHQLCHADVAAEFPPLRSLDTFRHNLPLQLTTFVGRTREIGEVRGLLAEHRLVTLTGSGGSGKTRLALHAAADVLDDTPSGAWHVDLAPVTDPDMVASEVIRALGALDDATRPPLDRLIRRLRDEHALVVIDNCEHLIGACASLAESLLQACPQLVLLATSREPLGVRGEVTYLVPSLTVPESVEPADALERAGESEAVQLFVERAGRVRPGFDLSEPRTAIGVANICRRLDGIPLAIELAAARIRVLSAEQIADALHDRFRLLTGGARTATARQQTLRASVDWSHDLLTEPERVLFRRLAVFAGTFDLDAVEAVTTGDGIETYQVLDELSLLVDKSLVQAEDTTIGTRYRLLETVRQYALERLSDTDETDPLRRRHRDHYLAVAERVRFTRDRPERLSGVRADRDNYTTAFRWSLEHADIEVCLRFGTALSFPLISTGAWAQARAWLDEALNHPAGDRAGIEVRILALVASAMFEGQAMDPKGQARAEQALRLARELANPRLLSWALTGVGMASIALDPRKSADALREAVDGARGVGSRTIVSAALSYLGLAEMEAGRTLSAREVLEECARAELELGVGVLAVLLARQGELDRALELARGLVAAGSAVGSEMDRTNGQGGEALALALRGDPRARRYIDELTDRAGDWGMAFFVRNCRAMGVLARLVAGDAGAARAAYRLTDGVPSYRGASVEMDLALRAEAELATGDIVAARTTADQAVRGDPQMAEPLGWGLRASARVAAAEGDVVRAIDNAHRALDLLHANDERVFAIDTLELLASLAVDSDSHEEAARLLGAATAARTAIGAARFGVYDDWYDATVNGIREALGEENFDRAWTEGTELPLDDATAYAQRGRGARKRPAFGWDSLTPAELDVAALVAEGLTNRDIAAKLFISPRTVHAHLSHIYAKLGVSSRVQLANQAAGRT